MKTLDTVQGQFVAWEFDALTKALVDGKFWDEHILPTIDQADPSGWAIDIGANIGWFTVYMARRFQHVIAVEAHPETARLLRTNLRANGASGNVDIIPAAAYDHHTMLEVGNDDVHGVQTSTWKNLDDNPHSAGISFIEMPDKFHPLREWRVPTVLVDDYVPRGAHVSLIKADCQGAALRALNGLSRTIARCRPVIIVEYEGVASQARGDGWGAYEEFLSDYRYTWTRLQGPWDEYACLPSPA